MALVKMVMRVIMSREVTAGKPALDCRTFTLRRQNVNLKAALTFKNKLTFFMYVRGSAATCLTVAFIQPPTGLASFLVSCQCGCLGWTDLPQVWKGDRKHCSPPGGLRGCNTHLAGAVDPHWREESVLFVTS